MEQQQRSLIFTAAVGLIILAIIVGSIYYLVKFIQGRVASSRQTPQSSVETIAQVSANPEGTSVQGSQFSLSPQGQPPQIGGNVGPDLKIYNGGNFQFTYPKNWGMVKCTNSKNLELDPLNSQDSSIVCDVAIKPITILVDNISGCVGETVKIGNLDVIKSQTNLDGYIKYQWCSKTEPVLNITHRVSQSGERATSKQDFSKQVEEIIAKLTFSRGS